MTTELEKEFDNLVRTRYEEIQKHLKNATESLEKAINVAEECGLPFRFNGYNDGDYGLIRKYVPASFFKKGFNKIDGNSASAIAFSKNAKIYLGDLLWEEGDTGWEEWRTSSLTC